MPQGDFGEGVAVLGVRQEEGERGETGRRGSRRRADSASSVEEGETETVSEWVGRE